MKCKMDLTAIIWVNSSKNEKRLIKLACSFYQTDEGRNFL